MKSPHRFMLLATLATVLAAQAAIVPAPDDQEEPSVAANGNGYFAVWADKRTYSSTEYDIFGARVSATGEVLDPGGIPICTDPGRQTSPRVAFDGEKYLVVWEDDRESTSAYLLSQIYGARVTSSGQVMDPNGFKITMNRVSRLGPAVASDGHGFYVAWGDWHRTDGAIEDVYGSPVSSDGVVANPDGIPLVLGPGWQGQPRLAFAKGEYLMTYRDSWNAGTDIWGIRISTSGHPHSPAFRISNSGQEAGGRYGLTTNGRDCFVVWGDHRGSPSGFGYPKIYGTLIRSNVVVSPNGIPVATNSLYQDRPRVASDGNDFLVVWQESNDPHQEFNDIYAAKLSGEGTVGAPARIAINRAPGVQFNPDVAYTAGNYLVAWQDGRSSPNNSYPLGAFDVYGTLVSDQGAVSNADGILISGRDNDAPARPVVSLELVDADAAETLITQNNIDWAEFRVRRTGPVTSDLLVSLNTQQGSARLGEDYILDVVTNGFTVRIPAGASSIDVRLYPIDDAVYEGDETVFVHLVPPPPMGDPPYQIDFAHSSVAMVIHDNDGLTEASLVITKPRDGANFRTGETILIEATAVDLESYISRVEFWDGDQKIGVSEIFFIRAPDPGTPIFHSFEWQGAASGLHMLTARTTRADGTSLQSQSVRITVGSEPPGDRELHVIGVYSGTGPDGGPSRNNERGDVSLTVNRPGKRVTLLLSAYEPVLWHVTVGEGTIVEKVILGGYHRQQVEGLPADVELVPSYYEGGTGNYLYIGYAIESTQFYRTVPKLCALTGLNISSFQGRYQATHPTPFVIDRVQDDPRLRCDYPEPVPPDELPGLSFRLSFYGGTGSGVFFQNYTLGGPQNGTRLLPDRRVVADNGGRFYYGIESQSVFKVDSQTGIAQEMAQPPALVREGWPMGVAFDTARQRLLVVSLGGEGFLHAYSPAQNNWSLVTSMNNLDLDCLEYHAGGDALYGIGVTWGDYGGPLLYEFSAEGMLRRQISVPIQPFGIGPSGHRAELVSVGDYLVLLLEASPAFGGADHQESRMYLIDPRNGQFWLTYRKVGVPPNRPPVVSIVTPTDGARFNAGATIELGAQVTDADANLGPMTKVEFYANGTKVGEAPGPTTAPVRWMFGWTHVAAGEYVLTARVSDLLGATATSPPVHITVGQAAPVVRIEATSRVAEESSDPLARPSLVGEFTVSRTGPTTWSLPVFVQYSGTATPGADYQELPFIVTIPEGSVSTTIQVRPVNDGVPEGIETVVAKVSNCPPPGSLMPCIDFGIDPLHPSATVFIRDDGITTTSLVITRPREGETFRTGNTILIEAIAVNLNGYISLVEFWNGEQRIGVSGLVSVPEIAPGTPARHSFEWRGAAPGPHVLTARSANANGTMLKSPPVHINVEPTDNQLPRIAITRPTAGSQFPPETAIEIVAEARDPDGFVPRVEFFADGRKIGERSMSFLQPPEPGQPQTFTFVWRFSTPGSHVLTARATDDDGATAESAPLEIRITTPDLLPVVNVTAQDAFAVEPASNAVLDPAAFRIRRFGPTNGVLVVNYSLHGTAENGVDYERLSGLAVIPAGQRYVTVFVRPLADNLTEQMEPVILQLEETQGEPPPTYRVGQSRRAVAVISDLSMPHAFASADCLLLPDGSRSVCFPAQTGQNFRLEASNDLRNWETLCNTPAFDGALHFVDEEAANFPHRFYRLTPEPVAVADE